MIACEVADLQLLVKLRHDDRAEPVEQLSGVEAEFTIAADIGNDVVEIFEHDILLRHAAAAVRTMGLAHRLADCGLRSRIKNGLKFGALPSDVIGMNGVVTLNQMSNCGLSGALATV